MPVINDYLTNQEPAPSFPEYLQMINQGNQVPPDQAQLASMGPATPPTIHDVPVVGAMKAGPGLQPYFDRSLIDQYKHQTQESLNQQKSGIAQLEQYAKDFAQKPTNVDYTALGSLADQMNGAFGQKTNIADAAYKTRGMTDDDKAKALLEIQEKIQGAKAGMSKDDLLAQGQITSMLHGQQMLAHQQAIEKSAQDRSQAFLDRNNIARDNQSQHAGSLIDNDSVLKTLQTRKNQIDIDKDTLRVSPIVPPQMMDEMASGLAVAFSGGRTAGLAQAEKQELESIQKDFAKARGYAGKPVNALTPDQRQFLDRTFDRVGTAYDMAMGVRANQLSNNRSFQFNPHANDILKDKAAQYAPKPKDVGASGDSPAVDADLSKMSNEQLKQWLKTHGG